MLNKYKVNDHSPFTIHHSPFTFHLNWLAKSMTHILRYT